MTDATDKAGTEPIAWVVFEGDQPLFIAGYESACHEHINDVVMVDQSPIGRTTRSNPASYVGAFEAIRALYAKAPLAVERKSIRK